MTNIDWGKVLELARNGNNKPKKRVEKTNQEWKTLLTIDQYHMTREAGTERAFSSEMCSIFEPGIYACICCKTELFDASNKFESNTGWPSFTDPLKDNVISFNSDESHGMTRIEAVCSTCDAHQGHVFPDGPKPSGLRYCMNALSLEKVN